MAPLSDSLPVRFSRGERKSEPSNRCLLGRMDERRNVEFALLASLDLKQVVRSLPRRPDQRKWAEQQLAATRPYQFASRFPAATGHDKRDCPIPIQTATYLDALAAASGSIFNNISLARWCK
jgi:hypothetical protein